MIGIRYLSKEDTDALNIRETLQAFARHTHGKASQPLRLVDGDSEISVELTPEMARFLHDILFELLSAETKPTLTYEAELSDRQAAALLGVSRKYFIGLLESGALPYCKRRGMRTVLMEDLVAYDADFRRQQEAFLDEMVAEAQEMGLYD